MTTKSRENLNESPQTEALVAELRHEILGLQKKVQELSKTSTAQNSLLENSDDFQTLANSMSQLAWMTDKEGAIHWYNQRWYDYTGTNFEQVKNIGWVSVHHPDHIGRVLEKWTRNLKSGEPWEDTFPLLSASGEWRWFLSRARPIRNAAVRLLFAKGDARQKLSRACSLQTC